MRDFTVFLGAGLRCECSRPHIVAPRQIDDHLFLSVGINIELLGHQIPSISLKNFSTSCLVGFIEPLVHISVGAKATDKQDRLLCLFNNAREKNACLTDLNSVACISDLIDLLLDQTQDLTYDMIEDSLEY